MADNEYMLLSMIAIVGIVAVVVMVGSSPIDLSLSDEDLAGEAVRWRPGAEEHWCLCNAGINHQLPVWTDEEGNPEPQLYGEACGNAFIVGFCQFDAEWYGFPNAQSAITEEVYEEV